MTCIKFQRHRHILRSCRAKSAQVGATCSRRSLEEDQLQDPMMQIEEQGGGRECAAFVEGRCNQASATGFRVVLDLSHDATARDVRGKATCRAPESASIPLLEGMLLLAKIFLHWLVQQPNSSDYKLAKGMPSVVRNGRSFTLPSLDKPIFSRHLVVSCLLLCPADLCCQLGCPAKAIRLLQM